MRFSIKPLNCRSLRVGETAPAETAETSDAPVALEIICPHSCSRDHSSLWIALGIICPPSALRTICPPGLLEGLFVPPAALGIICPPGLL